MSDKIKAVSVEQKELSREEKKKLRRETMVERDSLGLDESVKKPGQRYRLVNLTSGNVDKWRSRGYEVVDAPEMGSTLSPSGVTSANGCIEVEVGKKSSQKAVWMETSEENYQILRELEAEAADAQLNTVNQIDIPEANQIGKVTMDKFKS